MFSATERYATGTRNAVAVAVNEADGTLYATLHGRNHLGVHWPKLYTREQNNELPVEVFVRIDRGDFGWSQRYFDGSQRKHARAGVRRRRRERARCLRTEDTTPPDLSRPLGPERNDVLPRLDISGEVPRRRLRRLSRLPWSSAHASGKSRCVCAVAAAEPTGRFEEFATGFAGATAPAAPTAAPTDPSA